MLEINLESLHHFMSLFNGHETMHGAHIPLNEKEGKKKGKCTTVHEKVTEALYVSHLNGNVGLGICPLREDNTVIFGAIDIDTYDEAFIKSVLGKVVRLDMPVVPFRSKSGGVHLYLFLSYPVSADKVKTILSSYVKILGLPDNTEVFPKQVQRTTSGNGNWINLPYFDWANGNRTILVSDCSNFEQAMDYAFSRRKSIDELEQWVTALPLSDAPCCLQNIWLTGDLSKNRNMFLFELANYAKAKAGIDGYKEIVLQYNSLLPEPLGDEEIERTIFNSQDKQTYRYACAGELLKPYCSRQLCKEREFGKDSGSDSNLDYGQLIRYKVSPVYWTWVIDGITIQFTKAEQFSTQKAFIHKCMEHLFQVPKKMDDAKWLDILNQAFANMQEVTSDFTAGSNAYIVTNARDRILQYCVNNIELIDALDQSKAWATEDWRTIRFDLDALGRTVLGGRGDNRLLLRTWIDTLEPVPVTIAYKGSTLTVTEIQAIKLFNNEQEWQNWATKSSSRQENKVLTVDKVTDLFAQMAAFRGDL